MDKDFFAAHATIGRKLGWWSAVPLTIFWTLLWPVGLVWLVVSYVSRYATLDKSLDAQAKRRAARFLSWYPEAWRARHGEEFSDAVEGAIREGHGGPALTINVIRESNATRLRYQPNNIGILFWTICWLPLVGQGLVPMILKLESTKAKAIFLAFYLPHVYQWPFIIAMIAIGLSLLIAALKNTASTRAYK